MFKHFARVDLKKLVPIALAIAAALGLYAFRGAIFVSAPLSPEVPASVTFSHPLTGLPVEVEMKALPQVYAVVIENHPDAQPLFGLDAAFLVIEAPVEGGISRFLAFFHEGQEVDKIGPVRSARPYFVEWAQGMDAMFTHVGGSPAALELIASSGVFDLNQYWHGEKFWRVNGSRQAPHNVFTSTELLAAAWEDAKTRGRAPTLLYDLWRYADGGVAVSEYMNEAPEPRIDYPGGVYSVWWKYDTEAQRYVRYQNNRPHTAGDDDAEIHADQVAVLKTDVRVLDAEGRRDVRTVGEGKGVLYMGWGGRPIVWKKSSVSKQIKFFEEDGVSEVVLRPGTTWIEVIPD